MFSFIQSEEERRQLWREVFFQPIAHALVMVAGVSGATVAFLKLISALP